MGQIGIELQCRLDGIGRLGVIASEQLHVSEGYMSPSVSRADCDGPFRRGDSFIVMAIDDLHDA